MTQQWFQGLLAVVTGGTRGIGWAIASALKQNGAEGSCDRRSTTS